MADIEKQNGGMSNSNTLQGPHFPLGPDPGGHYPYTLGANAAQQALYQGGITTLRKIANPAPL